MPTIIKSKFTMTAEPLSMTEIANLQERIRSAIDTCCRIDGISNGVKFTLEIKGDRGRSILKDELIVRPVEKKDAKS